jgi:hypothetical protein
MHEIVTMEVTNSLTELSDNPSDLVVVGSYPLIEMQEIAVAGVLEN